jgi:hypothetical protein
VNFDHLLPRLVTIRAYATVNGKRLYAQTKVERFMWDQMDNEARSVLKKNLEDALAQEVLKRLDIQHEHD